MCDPKQSFNLANRLFIEGTLLHSLPQFESQRIGYFDKFF